MRTKPKGRKYRNLVAYSGVIYYERVVNGRRHRVTTRTNDWDRAATRRDLYEQRHGIGRSTFRMSAEAPPRLAEFARRYLAEDVAHLAPTTREERGRELAEGGPLLRHLGKLRLDEITEGHLREWWTVEVQEGSRTTKTGRNYLDALSGVFGFANELGIVDTNPVRGFRVILGRKTRTQRGRAESEPGRDIRPIERQAELQALLKAVKEEGAEPELLVLLQLDAGLRLGEALGLRWQSVVWGEGDDEGRALVIDESRPRGGTPGPTKSGRSRRVALSRRLREALFERYRELRGPEPETHVLSYGDPSVFRRVEWRRILKRAGIGHRRLKDLRDTFASQLLTAGIPLGYVSKQLGHADVGVTVRHYARYVGDDYRDPPRLRPGDVPADLLARGTRRGGSVEKSPESPPSRPVEVS